MNYSDVVTLVSSDWSTLVLSRRHKVIGVPGSLDPVADEVKSHTYEGAEDSHADAHPSVKFSLEELVSLDHD